MSKNECYFGLELTSSSIKMVAGYLLNESICVLDAIEEKCNGLSDGLIINQDEVVKSIKSVVNQMSRSLNMLIDEVCLAIPPFNLLCMCDTGSTNTVDGNNVIRHIDTTNILTAMKKRSLADSDLKIIDIVPDTYMINNNERYYNEPIGKMSEVLSLHASIYAMSVKVIAQFENCVNNAGLKIKKTVIAPYADALYLSTVKAIPNSYFLIDIGNSVTTISQINRGYTVNFSRILKFGGNDITLAIANEFDISFEEAEELKNTYGIDHNPNFNVYIKDKITLDDLSQVIVKTISQQLDIFKTIIDDSEEKNSLPVVLIGGTSCLHNIKKIVADELELDVINFTLPTLGARKYGFVTVLGLIKYCAIQPKVNDEETITTQVNRINPKKNRNYKFDEEL